MSRPPVVGNKDALTNQEYFTKPSSCYTNSALFTQGNVSIHTLALSNTGDLLASGGMSMRTFDRWLVWVGDLGTNGIKLWDIKSHRELAYSNPGSYGAISCAIWIRIKYSLTETLCYGTALGYLVFLHLSPMMASACCLSWSRDETDS